MAPWLPPISKRFTSVPQNPQVADFFGPYNKLLTALFPIDTDFTVTPYPYFPTSSTTSAGHSVASSTPHSPSPSLIFIVYYSSLPAFILHLHSPANLRYINAREDADLALRRHVRDLRGVCPLPTLHAASVFGTKFCLYAAKSGWPILPERVPPHPEMTTDTAPQSRWDADVMEDEGAIKLKEVINEIRNQCENL